MRSYIVFAILVAGSGLFVVLQVTRTPVPHEVTVAPAVTAPKPGASTGTGTGETRTGSGAAAAAKAGTKPKPKAPAAPKAPLMKRPLRVVSLGWELIAPGVVANGGAKPGVDSAFAKERLPVQLAAFKSMEEVEAALARGGADPLGADVAIVPLPELVASHERLRALAPRIFLVLGWSRGRDGLMARSGVSLARPPRTRQVHLVGAPGSSATFFSLYMLELAGVPLGRVRLLEGADKKRAAKAPFAAAERPLPSGFSGDRKFLVTTADATKLVPVVAVAPEGLIKKHERALSTWGQVWIRGVERLQQDVPAAARQVAALKTAPHALDLLKRLGQIDPAPLMDNARLAGLAGRSPVTLEQLFRHCWRIWRAVGLISSPAPEVAPIHVWIMASMVRTYPALVEAEPTPAPGKSRKDGKAPGADTQTLLVHEPAARRWNERELAGQLALLAGVFERAALVVSVRESLARARGLVAMASSRFELPHPARLRAEPRKQGKLVRVELRTPR
jgi:hypothetical protein